MTKRIVLILVILLFQRTYSQVTFLVDRIPENTSDDTSIFITGDFEDWSGGQESYKLTKKGETFFISIPEQTGSINFKFTQGSWDSVETDTEGYGIDNRVYTFEVKKDTVRVQILSWDQNKEKQASTASENVFVLTNDLEIPQLKRQRRIWVYLPSDYENSTKSYPVMYMHDGQNLFDASLSYSGEWNVDETLNQLFKERGFEIIVIGIDNGGSKRLDEYSPWANTKYGGGEGDAYLEFIVETLKPLIDKTYRTIPERENTAIMGSSMGGLISFYAALKYSDIFSKVGVFSSAFWFSNESFQYARTKGNIQNTRMYLLAGGKEGEDVAYDEINKTVGGMKTIVSILKKEGFEPDNIIAKVVPEGKHNEALWRNEFGEAILWLFNK